jgi:hypothetical protein
MLFKTLSAAVYGIDANIIEVEVEPIYGRERCREAGKRKTAGEILSGAKDPHAV